MESPSVWQALASIVLVLLVLVGLRAFIFWLFGIGRILRVLESIDRKLGPNEAPPPNALVAWISGLRDRWRRTQ